MRRPRSHDHERRGDEEFRRRRRARSPARWWARATSSSARSTKATARSRATRRRSRCSTTSRSTTSRWTSCARCFAISSAKAKTAVLNLDNDETAGALVARGRAHLQRCGERDAHLVGGEHPPGARRASRFEVHETGRRAARRSRLQGARPAQRRERAGGARRGRARWRAAGRCGARARRLQRHAAPARNGGHRERRHRDRRFRAQSRQDRRDARDAA